MARIDLTGKTFGRLTVIELAKSEDKRTKWICKCECGNIKNVRSEHLRSGATTSCGCYQKEKVKEFNSIHNLTHTSLHNRWKTIKQRCDNPNSKSYKNYGGRGIKLCKEWYDFKNFYDWCVNNGYQVNYQLDRIDNDGHYEPNNIRIVPAKVNNRNRRTTAMLTVKGMKINLGDLVEIFDKFDFKIPSFRYRNKTVQLRELYNQSINTFGEARLEAMLTYEIYMKIPSQVFEEIQERCND